MGMTQKLTITATAILPISLALPKVRLSKANVEKLTWICRNQSICDVFSADISDD